MKTDNLFWNKPIYSFFCKLKVMKECLSCISLVSYLQHYALNIAYIVLSLLGGWPKMKAHSICFKDTAEWPITQAEQSFQLCYALPSGHAGTLAICFVGMLICMLLTLLKLRSAFKNQTPSVSRNYCRAPQTQHFHWTMNFSPVLLYGPRPEVFRIMIREQAFGELTTKFGFLF